MTEPKYTAQNILAGWDALQERNKKRRRFPTIINELHALSNPSFRNSAAYRRNQSYISTLGDADFTDYSRRMNMLAKEEQDELKSLFMGRMVDADLPNVEAFDEWAAEQGSFVWEKRNEFFEAWDKRMDTIREQTKYAEEGQVDTLVGGVMSQYYDRLAKTTDPNEQAAIIQEANSILTDLSSSGQLPYALSGKVRSTVNERLRKIVGDSRGVTGAIQKAQEREETIEDRNKAALGRALNTGRTITRNRLVQELIDRVARGEDYETVKQEVMGRATDMNSDDYLQDKDMLASLRQGIEFAKKPDARSTASKNFDETMALLRSSENRAFNVNKVIQLEIDSANTNPLFYEFTMPRKEAQAIEQAFFKLKMADPDAIDEQAFRKEFSEFAQTASNEQIEAALQRAEQQLGIPKRMLMYIIYGREGYQALIEGEG